MQLVYLADNLASWPVHWTSTVPFLLGHDGGARVKSLLVAETAAS